MGKGEEKPGEDGIPVAEPCSAASVLRPPSSILICRRRRGFTLLEVVMAVMIIALIGLTIYRFLEANLRAIQLSTQNSNESVSMEAFVATIRDQLESLPPAQAQPGALIGETHKFNELPSDELQWIAGPGNGLFTRNAAGDFRITLRLLPDAKGKVTTLGLRRMPVEAAKNNEQNWLPLIPKVRALEIRYFDPQGNGWVEKWTDQLARPALVRLRIWRTENVDPYEVVLPLSRAKGNYVTGGEPTGAPQLRPGGGRTPGFLPGGAGGPVPRVPGAQGTFVKPR